MGTILGFFVAALLAGQEFTIRSSCIMVGVWPSREASTHFITAFRKQRHRATDRHGKGLFLSIALPLGDPPSLTHRPDLSG